MKKNNIRFLLSRMSYKFKFRGSKKSNCNKLNQFWTSSNSMFNTMLWGGILLKLISKENFQWTSLIWIKYPLEDGFFVDCISSWNGSSPLEYFWPRLYVAVVEDEGVVDWTSLLVALVDFLFSLVSSPLWFRRRRPKFVDSKL